MQTSEKQVWFRAKKYGWGWTLPCCWQGWVTFAVWLVLLCVAAALCFPGRHLGLWIASVIGLAVAMFIICLAKGEKPRWRWGKD